MNTPKFDKSITAWQIYKHFANHPEEINANNIRAILNATQYLFECEFDKKPDSNFAEIRDNLLRLAKQEQSEEVDKNYIYELLSEFL